VPRPYRKTGALLSPDAFTESVSDARLMSQQQQQQGCVGGSEQ